MPPPSSWSVQVEAGGDCVVAAAVPDGYEQPGWLITGRFSGSVAFGAFRFFPALDRGSALAPSAFAAHLTSAGDFAWVVQVECEVESAVAGKVECDGGKIVPDGAGGALVSGSIWGTARFGDSIHQLGSIDFFEMTAAPSDDVREWQQWARLKAQAQAAFVMRVSRTGNIKWARHVPSYGFSTGNGVASDGAGGAFLVGLFQGSALFGQEMLKSLSVSWGDAFVMHVNASGAVDWTKHVGPEMAYNASLSSSAAQNMKSYYVMGNAIAPDGEGGALVTGSFVGRVWFGTTFMSSISYNDVDYKSCVFRITRDGAIDWCHQVICSKSIASDGLGGAFVAGKSRETETSHISIVHVTPSGEDWIAYGAGDPTTELSVNSLARDGHGGVVVAGSFTGPGQASFCKSSGDFRWGDFCAEFWQIEGNQSTFVAQVTPPGKFSLFIHAGSKNVEGNIKAMAVSVAPSGEAPVLFVSELHHYAGFLSGIDAYTKPIDLVFDDKEEPDPRHLQLSPPPPLVRHPLRRHSPPPPSHIPMPIHGSPAPFNAVWVVAAVTSSLALLVACLCLLRYRRRVQFLRASRDRVEISLNMLEHQVEQQPCGDVERRAPPSDTPPNSIPPGPPSSAKPSTSSSSAVPASDTASDRPPVVEDHPWDLSRAHPRDHVASGRSVGGLIRSTARWIPLQSLQTARRTPRARSPEPSTAARPDPPSEAQPPGRLYNFSLYRGYFSGIGSSSSSSSSSSDRGAVPPRRARPKPRPVYEEPPVEEVPRLSVSAPATMRQNDEGGV